MNSFVVDSGSDTIRIGYSGDTKPKRQNFTFIATQKKENENKKFQSLYIGKEFLEINEKQNFDISHPMEGGVIKDFEKMAKIWEKTFNSVGVENGDKFLLSDSYQNTKETREKIGQYMFEDISAASLYLMKTPVMATYSIGVDSGLVVNSGSHQTTACAVYEGFLLPKSCHLTNIGGKTITDSIVNHLSKFNFCSVDKIPRVIKEKLCYISPYDTSKDAKEYILPDSTSISLENGSNFTECLFQGNKGSHQAIQEILNISLLNLDENDISREFAKNIILTGGNSLLKGYEERLLLEAKKLNENFEYKTLEVQDKLNATWIGGSIASSLDTFNMMYITRDEYNEVGPQIIKMKCF